MKILISNDSPTAHYYIRTGFAKALSFAGHDVIVWDLNKKNPYDVFDEFEPDIFVSQGYNLNDAIIECILERPNLAVTLKCGDWSKFSDEIDLNKYPILTASQQEINNVLKIQNNVKYVDIHYSQESADITHEYWNSKLGIKVVGLMSAADVFDYTNGVYNEKYKSNIIFIGGRWGYKSRTIDKYILPLVDERDKIANVKIFGNQSWGIPEYLGYIPTEYVKHFLASSLICPNISEPHSQDFGFDIVERPFKLLSNKCFVISDTVASMKKVFNNEEIVFASSPANFKELCHHYIKYPNERMVYISRGYDTVINNHTYFHRAAQFFNELAMPEESSKMLDSYKIVKEKLCL